MEAGTSEHTRKLLAQADMADVAMAPSADMFEMGVKVQVLKRGTMFAPRASKLYEVYTRYPTWEEVPQVERDRLETTVFKRKYDEIWADTVKFFTERDPRQLERAANDLHQQMALVFRWYLGFPRAGRTTVKKAARWIIKSGAVLRWVLSMIGRAAPTWKPANRRVVDVARHILTGTAYFTRLRALTMTGISVPPELERYTPNQPLA